MAVLRAMLPGNPVGQVVPMSQAGGLYRGYALRETAGAPAVVRIYSGVGVVAANLLDTVQLPASASVEHDLEVDEGEGFQNGIYVQTLSGTTPEGFIKWSSPGSTG